MRHTSIEEIFNSWVERQVIRNTNLDIKMVINDSYFEGQSQRLFKKYGTGMSFNSFLSDYITFLYLAMQEFEATDSEWLQMADSEPESRLEELKRYTYKKVRYLIIDEFKANAGVKRMSVDNQNVNVALETLSLDYVYGNGYTMTEALTSESKLNAGHEYHSSWYKRWFDEVKADVLTNSQLSLLEALSERNVDEMSPDEFKALTGVDKSKFNTKMDAIAERLLKAYNKQKPLDNAGKKKLEQYLMIEELVKIMHSDSNVLNRLRMHVYDHFSFYADLLTLSHEAAQAVSERVAGNELLMNVCQQLLTQKEELGNEIEALKAGQNDVEMNHRFVNKKSEIIVNKDEENRSGVYRVDSNGMLLEKTLDSDLDGEIMDCLTVSNSR